ncbi:MAG: hypothetical protein ACLQBB_08160 [Solirubrobacteraceae bacterium]
MASEQMEALEKDFGEDESIHVGTVVTIVELIKTGTDDDGHEAVVGTTIRLRTNNGDLYHVLGVLDQAKHDTLQM